MPSRNDEFRNSVLYHGTNHAFEIGDTVHPTFDAFDEGESHATDSLDIAKRYGDHVYTVEPLGDVEVHRHDEGAHVVSRKGYRVVGEVQ